MKVVEKIQTRIDMSEKKMKLIATMLQTFAKNSSKEKGEKPRNEGGEDDKKKEEEQENSTCQPIHE